MVAIPPQRLAKWMGLAYAAAILGFLIWSNDGADTVLLIPLFWLWIIGPAAVAGMGADMSAERGGAWAFFWLEED
jgi:hypothetical protein